MTHRNIEHHHRDQTRAAFHGLFLDRHRRIGRAICLTLVAQDWESWQRLVVILGIRLSPDEVAALAWACMKASSKEDAARIAADVLPGAGAPIAQFMHVMDEARAWAAIASVTERKAYAAASFEAMSHDARHAFIAWAGEGTGNG